MTLTEIQKEELCLESGGKLLVCPHCGAAVQNISNKEKTVYSPIKYSDKGGIEASKIPSTLLVCHCNACNSDFGVTKDGRVFVTREIFPELKKKDKKDKK